MLGVAALDAPGVCVAAPNSPPTPKEGVAALAAEAPPVAGVANKFPPVDPNMGVGVPKSEGALDAAGVKREGAAADVAGGANKDRPVEEVEAAGCNRAGISQKLGD
jgi:hypothetical protein